MINYIFELKSAYVENKKEGGSDFYNRWMAHKLQHSLKVLKTLIDIARTEEAFDEVSSEVLEEFAHGAVLHDMSRAWEMPFNAKDISEKEFNYHGIRSAFFAHYCMGEHRLNVLIPALMHQFHNSDLMLKGEMAIANIESDLGDGEKSFLIEMSEKYNALSINEREILDLGIALIRDADKITNLLEVEKMLKLSNFAAKKEAKISTTVKEQLLNAPYVKYSDLQSYADEACAYMAFVKTLHFPSSRIKIVECDVLAYIKNYALTQYLKDGFTHKDLEEIKQIFNEGIDKIEEFLPEDIEEVKSVANLDDLFEDYVARNS